MSGEIEVQEQRTETATRANVAPHGEGCILIVGDKSFALDAETAMRLAWDLCVMFQEARLSNPSSS